MSKQIFPSWRYHKSEAAVVVNSEEEVLALGKGWADSPAVFDVSEKPKDEKQSAPDEKSTKSGRAKE